MVPAWISAHRKDRTVDHDEIRLLLMVYSHHYTELQALLRVTKYPNANRVSLFRRPNILTLILRRLSRCRRCTKNVTARHWRAQSAILASDDHQDTGI